MVCARLIHKKNTSKDCDSRDNNNNNDEEDPLFIYLQYYLQDIISINSNKNLQRINVHHDHRGGYFLIYRLSEKSVSIIGI